MFMISLSFLAATGCTSVAVAVSLHKIFTNTNIIALLCLNSVIYYTGSTQGKKTKLFPTQAEQSKSFFETETQ